MNSGSDLALHRNLNFRSIIRIRIVRLLFAHETQKEISLNDADILRNFKLDGSNNFLRNSPFFLNNSNVSHVSIELCIERVRYRNLSVWIWFIVATIRPFQFSPEILWYVNCTAQRIPVYYDLFSFVMLSWQWQIRSRFIAKLAATIPFPSRKILQLWSHCMRLQKSSHEFKLKILLKLHLPLRKHNVRRTQ